MYSLHSKPCTNYTQNYTLRRSKPYTKHRKEPAQEPYILFLVNTNHAKGASVLFVVTVCQNAHFGFTLEGASEWLRCKALRIRAQGVY